MKVRFVPSYEEVLVHHRSPSPVIALCILLTVLLIATSSWRNTVPAAREPVVMETPPNSGVNAVVSSRAGVLIMP